MKNNFYDIPVDWYKEFNSNFLGTQSIDNMSNNNIDSMINMGVIDNIGNINNIGNTHLVSAEEGFLKGNLFYDLYSPYKNYKYGMLKPSNKKEELLYDIMKYNFALTDLNLYLDMYPYDRECIEIYNKYLLEEKKLLNEYEKKYGPLTVNSVNMNNNNFDWIKSPWPWEGSK